MNALDALGGDDVELRRDRVSSQGNRSPVRPTPRGPFLTGTISVHRLLTFEQHALPPSWHSPWDIKCRYVACGGAWWTSRFHAYSRRVSERNG